MLITIPTVQEGLAQLGVTSGSMVMVHGALSSFGRVQGGAATVLEALQRSLGSSGTVVMPTFTAGRFDPSEWANPPMPEQFWDRCRFETPPFDAAKTPVDDSMSVLYELFRTWPDVVRTDHPHSSFAAWGRHARGICAAHRLDDRFGETSPLARLYELDATVVFLGTGYGTCTAFHLSEYRRAAPPQREYLLARVGSGRRILHRYTDVDTDSSIFADLGADFENVSDVTHARIGAADCRSFALRDAVDFGVAWLQRREASSV